MHEPQDDREELDGGHQREHRQDNRHRHWQKDQDDLRAGDGSQPQGQRDEVVVTADFLGEEVRVVGDGVGHGVRVARRLLGERQTRAPEAARPEVLDEVDDGEDDNPNNVDEVPVEARNFDI